MAYSFKRQTHKSKGLAGQIPHPVGASPHSGARKNRLRKVLEEREDRFAKRKRQENKAKGKKDAFSEIMLDEYRPSKPKPKPKPKPKRKIPTITPQLGPIKRRPTMEEQRKSGANVMIDYEQLDNLGPRKKYGGKITYKMSGGQVVDSSYD